MFFSQNGDMAHIWCAEADNPLCLAQAGDFPEVWPTLEVGLVVDMEIGAHGGARRVTALQIVPDAVF